MKKGWRNDLALVERRERLQRERYERQIELIKFEAHQRMHEAERSYQVNIDEILGVGPSTMHRGWW
jgi:NAD(P)H-hydrate repair Nnr-like enzyme with NAD(P)H-hydrate epimerase domain